MDAALHVGLNRAVFLSDYAREELGVIVAKTSQPPVVLVINESNLTAAFWDFLKDIIGEKDYESPNKEAVINYLQDYLKKLDVFGMTEVGSE